jgi:DNA-binding transcriptional MerR regulator
VTVPSRGVFSIGALARILGISPATLRTWEERYRIVVPERSAGAQRLYSRDDLERLQFVCAQMERGVTAADAHRLLGERMEQERPFGVDRRDFDASEPPSGRIVLVERDAYAADAAAHFLRSEGYDVDVARSTAAADELIASTPVDLVVVDLMIDCGAGLGWCARTEVPALAVSTLDLGSRALAAGARAFLHKPLDPVALVAMVRGLIGAGAGTLVHSGP